MSSWFNIATALSKIFRSVLLVPVPDGHKYLAKIGISVQTINNISTQLV